MDIADIATKAVKKISSGRGKKLAKKGYPEELPKVQPVTVSNKNDGKLQSSESFVNAKINPK